VAFTIDLPGIQDIIAIPALRSPKLRQQQIIRWKTANSPVPQPLKWIPAVVNFLDSAQDLLITALVIAKPLLRRAPSRFIPYLGWILTINDAVNLTNTLLAAALASRTWKRSSLRSALWMWTRRNRRLRAARAFLSATNYFSFTVQALQVTRDWTGYGLQLGSAMAFITDSIWGIIRQIQGEKVIHRAPPKESLEWKAANFLAQYPQHIWMKDVLTADEHYMCIIAGCLAAQIIRESTPPSYLDDRAPIAGELSFPTYFPSNPSSIWALQDAGIYDPGISCEECVQAIKDDNWQLLADKEDAEFESYYPFLPYPFPYPPIADVIRDAGIETPRWEDAMKDVFGKTTRGTLAGMMHNEMTVEMFNWAGSDQSVTPSVPRPGDKHYYTLQSGYEPVEHLFEDFEIDASHAVEYSVFPTRELTDEEFQTWLTFARNNSGLKGFDHASFEDLKQAAVAVLGGFERRPYQTFPGK
jgi:hypothetical protein